MFERWRALSPRLRLGLKLFFALCAGVTLLDLVISKDGDYWWNFFAFTSAYGFIACVLLVVIAAWMRRIVMRDEDYYDE